MGMRRYDMIIAGGGASGLSLACHLAHSALRDRSILIVDWDAKDRDDRTWSFWADQPTLFDSAVSASWRQIKVAGKRFAKTLDLGAYRYQMIRGIDFYRYARSALSDSANVEFRRGRVERIDDGPHHASVVVDGEQIDTTWVFDSIFTWPTLCSAPAERWRQYHNLKQQFEGWEIEAPTNVFDTQVATFQDFRTPQLTGMRFLYTLPLSPCRALVEYVLYTSAPISREMCESALRAYLARVLGLDDYRILRREQGVTPLTDWPFPRRVGQRVMTIGIKGGRIKPSTGYAFARMQVDANAIVQSLIAQGDPFHVTRSPLRYRYFDAVLLDVIERRQEWAAPIFTDLFRRNSAERLFRLLDETASVWDNLRMIPSLPPQLLLQAAMRLPALGRV